MPQNSAPSFTAPARPFRRHMPLPPMALFALAALAPLGFLALALGFGGLWALGLLLYVGVFTAALDHLLPYVAPDAPEGAEFPAADALLVVIGLGHLVALPVRVWAVAGDSGLSGAARAVLFLGMGQVFGQVSNPAAHELIHRGGRGLYRLGVAVYVTLPNGHHASAHRLVHHRFVATPDDPNSTRSGEGFWRFLLAIRMAINAGVDILTFSNNISGSQERTVDKVHEIIKRFVLNGTISKERIDHSYKRIMNIKRQLNGGRAEYYREALAEKQ